jgi:hypothetical protein
MHRPEHLLLLLGFTALTWPSRLNADTVVFRGGEIRLPIYVASDCTTGDREAAEELARVLGLISGVPWAVRPEEDSGQGIFVGHTRAARSHLPPLVLASDWIAPRPGEVGPDAFRIRTIGGCIYIEGATPDADYFAVTWLLQHECGVRWYAPGPLGESIPRRAELSLRDLDVVRQPAYLSREFSGYSNADGAEWCRRNGLRARLEFSHALGRAFPPDLFAEHPGWFPLLWGKRYDPKSMEDRDWQPNLAVKETADHAARVALDAFNRQPSVLSFSLGMNDTVRFDQGPETQSLVTPLKFYRGMPDYSPLVFTFMNRAAGTVSAAAPDRYLGCLAYFWCANTPLFPMQSHVIPYLAADRSQYCDPGFRAEDLELMSRWGTSGVKIFGLWDYAYGEGFVIPREPVRALAEAIREGWRRGARGYFAEIIPNPGFDAFKAWAMAQLLWDPGLSLTDLEDDFFPGYYGPAQVPMRRFFEACQAQWMGQPGSCSYWLKYYKQEDQALLFPSEVCSQLSQMLAEAKSLAAGDAALEARVDLSLRAFAVTEAYVAFDSIRRRLATASADEGADYPGGDPALSEDIGRLMQARNRLDSLSGAGSGAQSSEWAPFVPESLLRNDPVPRLLLIAGRARPTAPWNILTAAGNAAVRNASWRAAAEAVAARLPATPNLLLNGSFTEASRQGQEPQFLYSRYGILPAHWTLKAMPTETGRAALVDEAGADAGRRALRIEGAWDTQVYQWMPATSGNNYVGMARLKGRSSAGSDVGLVFTFLSEDGAVLGSAAQSLPKGDTGQWRTLVLAGRAPQHAAWVGLAIGCTRQAAGDWIEADSAELHSMPGEALPR